MVRVMCGVQLKDRKIVRDLMLMFGLNEILDQFGMTNIVRCYGNLLMVEDGH